MRKTRREEIDMHTKRVIPCLDVKDGRDEYVAKRKAVREKTHNVCDNYCQRVLDYFHITK